MNPCDHWPNDAGTACRYCGLAAEPVPAATLTRLLSDALAARTRCAIREAIATDGRGSAAHHAAIARRDCGLTHRHPTH